MGVTVESQTTAHLRRRREWGVHATNPTLAAHIVERTFAHWCCAVCPATAPVPSAEEFFLGPLRTVRILDPAVGGGVFLVAALRRLTAIVDALLPALTAGKRAEWIAYWLEHALFGTDIDANALGMAQQQLRTAAVELGLSKFRAARIPLNLVEADALQRRAWRRRFPRPSHESPAPGLAPTPASPFDLVLMNPPWVSYGNRQSVALSAKRRDALRRQFPLGFSGFPSSHGPFLELAAELGDFVGAIVPEQVAHLAGYANTRHALVQRHELAEIERVGETMFPGVKEPAVIFIFTPAGADAPPRSTANWLLTPTATADAPTAGKSAQQAGFHASALRTRSSIVTALAQHPTLGDRCAEVFCDMGVHTGAYAKIIIAKQPPAESAAPSSGEAWQPIRRGKDVQFHVALAPSEWVRVSPAIVASPPQKKNSAARRTLPRIPDLSRHIAIPVLIRQTADRPIAALHATHTPTYFRNSLLAARDPERLGNEWCAALLALVLNSAPIAFFHRAVQPDAQQRTSPQVKIRHLRQLPAPEWPTGLPAELVAVSARIIECQRRRTELTVASPLLPAHSAELDALESGLTVLVAEWLGLTRAQTAVIAEAVAPWSKARSRRLPH